MKEANINQTPEWGLKGNVYEVNLRQYSESGLFEAFAEHLPRLKNMGVEILWFMPITPIGVIGRKMTASDLGSYYAVRDYYEVSEEFGTMEEWKGLVRYMHEMGFKVIVDWVANHTSPDNPWTLSHPEYYHQDSNGNLLSPNADWTDTRQLNYDNPDMRRAMIDAMKFWITETGIDGYRCDMAKLVAPGFWKEAIAELKNIKDVLMIGEAEDPGYYQAGFDAQYTWSIFHAMKALYNSNMSVQEFAAIIDDNFNKLGEKGQRLFFTSNHDENTWNGTEYDLFGDAVKCFAVFCFTMKNSLPLIYSGQEIPNKKRLAFFTKDPIQWAETYEMEDLYKTLLSLRKNNPALSSEAGFRRLITSNDNAIHAYVREAANSKAIILLNLSRYPQTFTVEDNIVSGKVKDVFMDDQIDEIGQDFTLGPWGYLVYEY
jgi:alpha-amylase